jgi:hypothetical protein
VKVTAFEVRCALGARPVKPVRDPEYRRYVRSQPCCVSGKSWSVEACHTGPHGMNQKACDLSCIPLTRKLHQEYDASPRVFAERHGLDVAAVVARLCAEYRKKEAA